MLERLQEAGEVEDLPLDYVIYALGIPGIDWHKADLLAARFDYIYELSVASMENILEIEGISERRLRLSLVFSAGTTNWYGS